MSATTLLDAAAQLRSGAVTSVGLVQEAIAAADRLDEELRVYTARFDDTALVAAEMADADFAAGIDRGPLQGIPIGVKDNVLTQEAPTTGSSFVRDPAWEQLRDAPVVARLRASGAVPMGKTSMLEFAVGVPERTRPMTEGRNPWSFKHWAGGSSTGSAAGVAGGLFFGAVGTDTGASVRLPSAFCGTTGIRPTSGLVPAKDVIALAYSLDAVGPMAKTAADVAAMLQVMADPPPLAAGGGLVDYAAALGSSIAGLRIGADRRNHLFGPRADPVLAERFDAAIEELRAAGATVVEVELPNLREVNDALMLTVYSEGGAVHHDNLCEQWDAYGPPTRLALARGALLSASDYVLVQRARTALRRGIEAAVRDVDFVMHPTAATAALSFDGFNLEQLVGVVFGHHWPVVGWPAMSVPMGFNRDGLPLGMTIVGRPYDETRIIGIGDAYQRRTTWHLERPTAIADVTESRNA